MTDTGGVDVLEQGAPRQRRVGTGLLTAILVAITTAVIAAAGIAWWNDRPPTSPQLGVTSVRLDSPARVTIEATPPIGALASPAGTALPGATLRLTVGGDAAMATTVVPSTAEGIYVEAGPEATIDPGGFVDMPVTVAPSDCSAPLAASEADVTVLRTSTGDPVPLGDDARSELRRILGDTCREAGAPPQLTVTAARRGGQPPLETVGIIVDVDAAADRLVLTPLDGPGLRGLGAADRRTGTRIPLLWLVSPEAGDGLPMAYAQVYVIRGETAYPWVVPISITDDLPPVTPLTTSIR